MTTTDLVTLDFRGSAIRREGDWLHATDMHRACGADPNKAPAQWQRLPQTQEYLTALAVEESHSNATRVVPGRGDRGGGTWLHRLAAVEYARYLDPAFAVFVNKVFLAATEPRPNDSIKIAAPQLDVHALAREVANLVLEEVRALPAPAVLALPVEQLDAAVTLAADGSAHAMLERYFTSPNPAKTLGVEGATWIRLTIGEAADAESLGLVPDAAGAKARSRKRKSLVSTYHYDMRQAVRCGGGAYAEVESIYRDPILKWMRRNRERIERAHPNAFQRKLPFDPAAE